MATHLQSPQSANGTGILAVVRSPRSELALALLDCERFGSISPLSSAQEWVERRQPAHGTLVSAEHYREIHEELGEQSPRTGARCACTSWIVLCAPKELARLEGLFDRGCVRLVPWPIASERLQARVEEGLAEGHERQWLLDSIANDSHRLRRLSRREIEVLEEIRRGCTSKEVAGRLLISKRTVDDHRRAMLRKTESATMAELVSVVGTLGVQRARYERLTYRCPTCPREGAATMGVERVEDRIDRPVGPIEPSPPPRLSEFGRWLREFEEHEDPCCVLDEDDRIQWTNESWNRQAGSTSRYGDARSSGLGSRYVDGLRPPMARWFADALRRIRRTREPWTWTYPCPTPERRSTATVCIEPLDPYLLVRHTSEPGPEWTHGLAADDASLEECMHCRRVHVHLGHFEPSKCIFDAGRDVQWVLCPVCRAELSGTELTAGPPPVPESFRIHEE